MKVVEFVDFVFIITQIMNRFLFVCFKVIGDIKPKLSDISGVICWTGLGGFVFTGSVSEGPDGGGGGGGGVMCFLFSHLVLKSNRSQTLVS